MNPEQAGDLGAFWLDQLGMKQAHFMRCHATYAERTKLQDDTNDGLPRQRSAAPPRKLPPPTGLESCQA